MNRAPTRVAQQHVSETSHDDGSEIRRPQSPAHVSNASRLRVPTRTNTPSTTLPATDPRARALLCFLKTDTADRNARGGSSQTTR